MSINPGKLYIVATPIGNMADMTFRAVEILKSVDVVLCEDTRTTKHLLDHYEVKNKLISFHSHSKLSKVHDIKKLISEGKNIALVSDAGTPAISDPGVMLVAELRKEFGSELSIIGIPGPSALITALSISGLPTHEFTFKGFVPHKKGRETFFDEIASTSHTVIFYESVHRIIKTLESLTARVGNRPVVVARELTKLFEETITGTSQEIMNYLESHPEKVRGEFVVVVGVKK